MGNVKDSKKNFNHKMNLKGLFGLFFCPSQRFFHLRQVTDQPLRLMAEPFHGVCIPACRGEQGILPREEKGEIRRSPGTDLTEGCKKRRTAGGRSQGTKIKDVKIVKDKMSRIYRINL
jgi:hypothetical protein